MGLFDSFLKRKTQEEEARLLLEEISWRITEEEVGLKKAREDRLLAQFAKYWEMDGNGAIDRLGERELPQILLHRSGEVEGEQAAEPVGIPEAFRLVLEEVWLRAGGKCRRCHRTRGLSFELLGNDGERAAAVGDGQARPLTSELLQAVGHAEDESDPLLELVEEPEGAKSEDKPALAEAKRRRKQRRLERARRAERRRLAGEYELVCRRCGAA